MPRPNKPWFRAATDWWMVKIDGRQLKLRSRLQVLIPDSPDNYYDQFNVVPVGLYDKLRQGKVLVQNWHKLDWESEEQIAKKRSVDKRGAKSDEAYVRDVLGTPCPP